MDKVILFFEVLEEGMKFWLAEEITNLLTEEEKENLIAGKGGVIPDLYKRMGGEE